VTGLEQRNALARPLLPPDGVAGGNSPWGETGGRGKAARGVTAAPVAGAALAYRPFISFLDPVYSLIYSLTCSLIHSTIQTATHPAICTATDSAIQIGFDFFHYIL